MSNPFRDLPAVHDLMLTPAFQRLDGRYSRGLVVEAVRDELDRLRQCLVAGATIDGAAEPDAMATRVLMHLQDDLRPRMRKVINATGIVLHTNLGRAPLAEEAAKAAYDAGRSYSNLELDLDTGKRSSRQNAIRDWLCRLTGAESATAVNNNAAATVIALRALCAGKEVIVSRGQLVEIGGGFRIPDIMAVSGAILKEVGTTNITRLADYEHAITPQTAAILRVHTSNFRVGGFTKSVPLDDLVALGRKHGLKVIDDVGSGALLDFNRFHLNGEPVVPESVAAGADLTLFSGDKLLGGPQAGILVGKAAWIQAIERDPLMRAFRLDKMTLAALEATLRIYVLAPAARLLRSSRAAEPAENAIPILRMLSQPLDDLKRKAETLATRLRDAGLKDVAAKQDVAYVGGGSLPDQSLPTWVVSAASATYSDVAFAERLRTGDPAVLGRINEGRLLLDARTIFDEDLEALVAAVAGAAS